MSQFWPPSIIIFHSNSSSQFVLSALYYDNACLSSPPQPHQTNLGCRYSESACTVYKTAPPANRRGHHILNHTSLFLPPFLSRSLLFLVVSCTLDRVCGVRTQSLCHVGAGNPGPNCPKRSALSLPRTIHQAWHGEDGLDEHRRVERDIARAELNFKKGWTLRKYEEARHTRVFVCHVRPAQRLRFEDAYDHGMKDVSIAK
jgi:hypothetical protein